MCWKSQNISAIAWYLTFFNQLWRFPCFFGLDAPKLSSRTIELSAAPCWFRKCPKQAVQEYPHQLASQTQALHVTPRSKHGTAQGQQSLLTWTHCTLGFRGIQAADHHNKDFVEIQTCLFILPVVNGEQIMDVKGQAHIDAIISPHMH